MSTVIRRDFLSKAGGLFSLSDDARRRAREYLASVGYDAARIQPIVWPEDAVSAYKAHTSAAWQFTTRADVLARRRELMEDNLQLKREDGVIRRVPLYVWVFWCPGVSGVFRGWWTYFVGLNCEYRGGGYKGEADGALWDRVQELFPVIDPILPGIERGWRQDERWMKEFARRYRRGTRSGEPQGKAPVWAEVEGGWIKRLLSRAEWPDGGR